MTNSRKPKDLLSQLPDDILLEILQYVYDARTKIGDSHQQKDKQIITLVSQDLEPLHLYVHNPEAPIMSSFHLFSTVNCRIHLLCQPFIWKVSYLLFIVAGKIDP